MSIQRSIVLSLWKSQNALQVITQSNLYFQVPCVDVQISPRWQESVFPSDLNIWNKQFFSGQKTAFGNIYYSISFMAYFKDFFRLSSTRYRRVVSHLFKQSRRIENMLTISWSQFHSDICVFAAWYRPDILNHPAAYLSSWPRYQYQHSHLNITGWLGCKWLDE